MEKCIGALSLPFIKIYFLHREPNQNYLQDVSWITGMKQYSYSHSSSHSSSYASHSSYQSGYSTYGGSYQSSAQDDSYQSSAQDSTYVSGQGETVPGSAYSSSHATSAGGGSATSTSAATTGGSSDHQQGQQTQQSTGFYPDFTSGDGGQGSGSYASASSTAYSGRRLKGAKETSNVFLHNTLKHPIVICGKKCVSSSFFAIEFGRRKCEAIGWSWNVRRPRREGSVGSEVRDQNNDAN